MSESTFRIRWDEIDPIGHLRHTGYSAFAAQARVELFESVDIGTNFGEGQVAPILFREELTYRREVRLGETIRIETRMSDLNEDASRWSIHQEVFRQDGQLSATVNTDGAWINLAERKLSSPDDQTVERMRKLIQ